MFLALRYVGACASVCVVGGAGQMSIKKLHWCHDGGTSSMTAKVTLKVLQSVDLGQCGLV